MNRSRFFVFSIFLLMGLLAPINSAIAGKIVVANRASGTISLIDTATDQVVDTIALPTGTNSPEPMYVVYSPPKHRVFVGDRANNQIVVFNAHDYSVEGTVPGINGIFHMWANQQNTQLWVINDVDNSFTVIDPRTLQVITTVPMPADLVADNGKPHDVVLDNNFAYITMIGFADANDYILKYSQDNFEEVRRHQVGDSPHLSLTIKNKFLYVPTQNTNEVLVLKRKTLSEVTSIPVTGAHGVSITQNGKILYTTNLPFGGTNGLFTIDTKTNTTIGSPVDTPVAIPHNIALTPNGGKIYVTHSGEISNKVTVYTVNQPNPVPEFSKEITVELNPYGLAFAP